MVFLGVWYLDNPKHWPMGTEFLLNWAGIRHLIRFVQIADCLTVAFYKQ